MARNRNWWIKLTAVCVLFMVLASSIELTQGQWLIATDVQKYYRCLPFDWFVITDIDRKFEPAKGDLVRFVAPKHVERYSDQYEIIKIVVGVYGDRWRIADDQLFINDELWGDLHLLRSLGKVSGDFDGAGVVPEGHIYVVGTNPSSYDSRYWGPLAINNINGKAHAIF